jgi:hypothetical protein
MTATPPREMALAGIILGFVWIGLSFIELGLALS